MSPQPGMPPTSGPPGMLPPGGLNQNPPGGAIGPNGQRNMSDYINAAIRQIEQSIESRDPNAPPHVTMAGGMPPHLHGQPPFPPMGAGPGGPPMGGPHPGHMIPPYDSPYPHPEMVQFDENNPHHPAFFDRMDGNVTSGFGNAHAFDEHNMSHPPVSMAPTPVAFASGNEPRPFDQSGPAFGNPTGHAYAENQFEPSFTHSLTNQTEGTAPPSTNQNSETDIKQEVNPGTPKTLSGPTSGQNRQKLSFNNSPDSVSRCSISPRDSGYDT